MNGLLGLVPTVCFPILVWAAVLAGLIKIVCDKRAADEQHRAQIIDEARNELICSDAECPRWAAHSLPNLEGGVYRPQVTINLFTKE